MRIDEKNGEKEMLEEARRLIDGEAATSAQISEGAKIVRNLAENGDSIEAWRYMLDCHERRIGPFKTNKFRRAAKEAIARLDAIRMWTDGHKGRFSSDLSWCDDKIVRESMLRQYANARRQRDRFVEDCVKPRIPDAKFRAAAERIGMDWDLRKHMSQTQAFAVIEFSTMYDDSNGYVPVVRGIEETKPGTNPDYDAAMRILSNLRYTWAKLVDMRPGCGLMCRDMLTGDEFFMFERNLSMSPQLKGSVLATGVMPVGGCYMHTGFSLPLPGDDAKGMLDGMLDVLKIPRKRPVVLSRSQTSSFAAVTIKSWLASGVDDYMRIEYK